MKVSRLLDHYMAEHGESAIVSVARTRSAVKNLALKFGSVDHTRLTPGALRSYRQHEGLAPATINREFAVLRAALRFAMDKGLIRTAPAVQKRPGAARRVSWLRPEEIKTLLAEAQRHPGCAAFVLLTLLTGQRLQAVLSLRWAQIDRVQNVIWFSDHDLSHGDRRKGRGNVPISPELAEVLDRLREGNTSPYVLTNRYGCRYRDINREHWAEIVAAAGLSGLVPHDLRHTVATNLIREQVPLIEISRLLGHASTKITEEIYVNHEPGLLVSATARLGQLVTA